MDKEKTWRICVRKGKHLEFVEFEKGEHNRTYYYINIYIYNTYSYLFSPFKHNLSQSDCWQFRGTAADKNAQVEQRQPWPKAAPQLVTDFIRSVKAAAEKKQLLAILTGLETF